jgi:hypothetical protein
MGQAVATVVMIIGYSIIAVPTGIITSEIPTQAGTLKEGYARTAVLRGMTAMQSLQALRVQIVSPI